MSNTIQIKRNSTANATPTAGQLSSGELAINTADGRLFAKNAAGTVVNLPVTSISGQDITPNTVDTVSLGAAATPAHSFSTDTDTGMYSPGANALAFATGGTQRIRVDSSGRVNIGTATSWTSRLLVDNGSMPGATQTEIFQVLDSSSSGDYINLGRFNVNRNAARGSFSLSNSGSGAWENNVLQFFVHGSTYAHGYYGGNNPTGGDAGCAMIVTQGSNIQKLQIGNYNAAPIEFFTSNTPRVKIATDGKVGIGTATPATALDVNGGVNITGQLDVDPTNVGQINCMYLNAGQSLGGSVTTDTFNVNMSITNQNTNSGATIDFVDDNFTPGFQLSGNFGLTVYSSSGALGSVEGPGSNAPVLSTDRDTGVIYAYRLEATAGIVTDGNSLRPGIQSPQTALYLWENFR